MRDTVNEIRASEMLCVAPQTLRNWRCTRKGPAYLKIGRCVRYRVDDLTAYMDRHKITPEEAA
jgi:hypothetical protein